MTRVYPGPMLLAFSVPKNATADSVAERLMLCQLMDAMAGSEDPTERRSAITTIFPSLCVANAKEALRRKKTEWGR